MDNSFSKTRKCALPVECERMNLSGHTSLDQLIGCFMHRFVNGARVFQWHEGRLISAIRAERWILLDELNLASNDVLQALTPLFYRSATTFTLHATGERLSLATVRIFATMNPSSTDDGRQRLSRSIKNLFHVVQAEDYSEAETRSILQRFFPGGQMNTLFDLHLLFKLQVTHGLLGRTRAAPDVNLRDLAKFHDVFNNLIDSQLFDDEHDQLPTSMSQSTATLVSLNKSAQIVSACQLPNRDEFRKACELIDETFAIPRTLNVNQRSIDESSPAFVRIGSICLRKGTEFVSSLVPELVHTRTTSDQLELLAAACQSKRTVLIEGDTCSGKTSLVSELARLTRNQLLIIPLHENFQPSDLIGSCLPSLFDKRQHPEFVNIDRLFNDILKFVLRDMLPLLSDSDDDDDDWRPLSTLKMILEKHQSTFEGDLDEFCANEIVVLRQMIDLLELVHTLGEEQVTTFVASYRPRLTESIAQLK